MEKKSSLYVSEQGFEYGVKHFYSPTSGRLVKLISKVLDLAENDVASLLNLGAIYVNHLRSTEDIEISEGQLLRVHTKPRRYNCNYNWKDLIVYENADFIVLNKPHGLPSHPSVDNRLENSLTQVSLSLGSHLHITHRLDTLTSGLIVYAKNANFVKSFNRQLNEHMIEKKYSALCETKQKLPERLVHYMEPSPRAPKKVSTQMHENWLLCELEILDQKTHSLGSWVKINLLTGRTHQIRAQLADAGAPLWGDTLYGSQISYRENAIALRACELQFNWGTQRLVFNLPENFDI